MPYTGGGGAGGGGLHFRNPPDEFTGANLAACRTARDTYFQDSANSGALPQFIADRSLAIVLNPGDSTDNTFETYVGDSTYAASAWLDRTDAIQGNAGPTGATGRQGDKGQRGSRWTVTDAAAPASPSDALSGDQQLLNDGAVHSYDGSAWEDSGVNIRGPQGQVTGGTDLSLGTRDANTVEVASSTGDNVELPQVTETQAGVAAAADKVQLEDLPSTWAAGTHAVDDQVAWDGKVYRCISARTGSDTDNPATDTTGWAEVGTGSGGTGETNLAVANRGATSLDITSDTGTDATIPAASGTAAGLASAADKTQIDDLPKTWAPAAHAIGRQVSWAGAVYLCIAARQATDTQNPAIDTTGWGPVAPELTAAQSGVLSDAPPRWAAGNHAFGAQVLWNQRVYRCIATRTPSSQQNPAADTTGWAEVDDRRPTGVDVSLAGTTLTVELETEGDDLSDTQDLASIAPAANETRRGLIEVATSTEGDTGTDTARAMTPAGVRRQTGAQVSSAERTAGTETSVRRFSPADVAAMAGVHATGLTESEVDARVRAGVEDEAEEGNTARWPKSKLPTDLVDTAALTAAVADFVAAGTITSERAAAITAALVGRVRDRGAWSAAMAYAASDLVRHAGATYLAIGTVGANTQAASEPGAGSAWRVGWHRIGFEDGPPNAFVGAQVSGNELRLTREGGMNPLQLQLPQTHQPLGLPYYIEYNAQSSPAMNLAPITNAVVAANTGEVTRTILAATVPSGLDLSGPLIAKYLGYVLVSRNMGSTAGAGVEISLGYRLFSGTANQITFWRRWRGQLGRDVEATIPMSLWDTTALFRPGPYPVDSEQSDPMSPTVTITQELFDRQVPFSLLLRARLYDRQFDDRDDTDGRVSISMAEHGVAFYQIGAVGGSTTRVERMTMQAIASGNTDVEAVPAAPAPLSVPFGDGANEILRAVQGNDVTVRAGIYFLDMEADIALTATGAIGLEARLASDDSVLGRFTSPSFAFVGGSTMTHVSLKGSLILEDDAAVNFFVLRAGNQALAANWYIDFLRWGGGREIRTGGSFAPNTVGTHTFSLTGASAQVALTDDTSGGAIVCPDNGYILAIITVPGLGLTGEFKWILAEDLRGAAVDTSLTAGLYTNNANEIFFAAGAQDGGASTGNEIVIQHIGDTTAQTDADDVILPSILRFDVEGDATPTPGDIGGDRYTFTAQISQSSEVGTARIVGFAGSAANPSNVAVLATLTNYHSASGAVTIPAGTMLASAGDVYTLRLEVYPTGKPTSDAPTIYHDFRITATAATAMVHFGVVRGTDLASALAAVAFTGDDATDIATRGAAAGSYTVSGIAADGHNYRVYFGVPTSLTQPTMWETSGFNITAQFSSAQARTISGVDYSFYISNPTYDDSGNGTVIVVS